MSRAAGLCAYTLAAAINTSKHQPPKTAVCIVKAGEKPKLGSRSTKSLLPTAADWQLQDEVGKWTMFPQPHSVQTRSPARRLQNTGIMPELTMPWEEESDEGKAAKYQDLVEECGGRG